MTRIIKLLLLCLVGVLPSVLAIYFYSQLRTQRIGSFWEWLWEWLWECHATGPQGRAVDLSDAPAICQ
jgi:hypothetical protein